MFFGFRSRVQVKDFSILSEVLRFCRKNVLTVIARLTTNHLTIDHRLTNPGSVDIRSIAEYICLFIYLYMYIYIYIYIYTYVFLYIYI